MRAQARRALVGDNPTKKDWAMAAALVVPVGGAVGAGARAGTRVGAALGRAGDLFDYSSLFLQLSLVLGAISLVTQSAKPRFAFYVSMIVLGVVGSGYAVLAFRAALAV